MGVPEYDPAMQLLTDLVKATAIPGSVAFLILGLTIGVLLLYSSRLARWGRWWLTALTAGYIVCATPIVASWLQNAGHSPTGRLMRAADARGARTVVVLGNGAVTYTDGTRVVATMARNTSFNVLEAARLYALLGSPQLILSGGIVDESWQLRSEAETMAASLEQLGVPRSRMVIEDRSRNTYEQSVRVRGLVGPGATIVLVTAPTHMPRAAALFEARGVHVVPSASMVGYSPNPPTGLGWLVPNATSLRTSQLVVYEYLALVNGWARGWFVQASVPD
jgi:uncharacterized SAM-binding protein YcdF (DUF218 family)